MSATKDAATRNRAEFLRDNRRDEPDGQESPDFIPFNCHVCGTEMTAFLAPRGERRTDSFGASVTCSACDYENSVTVTVNPVDCVRLLTVEVY
jgi:hypothetical protein